MNVKNLALGIGIIIVFALALWQGIEAFYPSPQYDDFCDIETPRIPLEENSTKQDNNYCYEQYQTARNAHSKVVFIISLIIGLIIIIVGYKLLTTEPVGSSLIGAGIWAIFWGSVVNWQNFPDFSRFIMLLITLVLLVWLTIKLNTQKKSFFQKVLKK